MSAQRRNCISMFQQKINKTPTSTIEHCSEKCKLARDVMLIRSIEMKMKNNTHHVIHFLIWNERICEFDLVELRWLV